MADRGACILPVDNQASRLVGKFSSAGRMPTGPTAKMAMLLKIHMRGSTSNRQSGMHSNRKARNMKRMRTVLK